MENRLDDLFTFKFHWLNENGSETGFLRKKGSFDGETLVLADVEIPVVAITHLETRERRVILSVATDEEPAIVAFAVSGSSSHLKSVIDVARSASWAEFHKAELEKEGRGHAFRSETCPQCDATLVLTDMPQTPQLYCHFCELLSTVGSDEPARPDERHLKVCEECGMFSKPRKFTIFYFYFLVFVYGYSQRVTWRCPPCMRGEAWKMLFGNLLFVIGVPVALTQLFRSYGGTTGFGPFAGLDKANLKARKADIVGAMEGYREILERVPHSAGVKYNLGLALLQQNDMARAAESFRIALEDCSNYVPAYHQLSFCYQQLGEPKKLAELNRIWGTDDDNESVTDIGNGA